LQTALNCKIWSPQLLYTAKSGSSMRSWSKTQLIISSASEEWGSWLVRRQQSQGCQVFDQCPSNSSPAEILLSEWLLISNGKRRDLWKLLIGEVCTSQKQPSIHEWRYVARHTMDKFVIKVIPWNKSRWASSDNLSAYSVVKNAATSSTLDTTVK